MQRIDLPTIQSAINAAPAFARIGLSVRNERLREQAVHALSVAILEHLGELPSRDSRQLTLPLGQDDNPIRD